MEIPNQNVNSPSNSNAVPPKTWLVESILVTIFCCQILGIISIIYSASIEAKFYRGDVVGAENASRTAKTLVLVSVAFGALAIVSVIILSVMGVFAGYFNS